MNPLYNQISSAQWVYHHEVDPLHIPTMIVVRSRCRKMYENKSHADLEEDSLECKVWLERVSRTSMKRLHMDQGREYTGLGKLMQKGGTVHRFSTP